MKKALFLLFLLTAVILRAPCAGASDTAGAATGDYRLAAAEELEAAVDDMLSGIDFEAWDSLLDTDAKSAAELVASIATGAYRGDPADWVQGLVAALIPGLSAALGQMGLVIGLAVLGGVLGRVSSGDGIGGAAQTYCFILSAACVAAGFAILVRRIVAAIGAIIGFADTILPTLLALLTAVGAPTAAGAFAPMALSLTFICTTVMRGFLVGLLVMGAALCVIKNLDSGIRVDSAARLIKGVCQWALGLTLCLFGAALMVNGVAAATLDGVSLRTAKYAIDNFIPIAGGMMADSFDTLVGCCLIVKNAVGVAGLIWVVYLLASPALSLVAAIAAYRLSAALLDAVGCPKTVGLLEDLAGILTLFLAIAAASGLMLMLLIAAVLSGGGMVTSLR